MKKFALGLLFGILVLSACDEDPCVAPDLADNIVDTWLVPVNGDTLSVVFKPDGLLVDDNDALIAGSTTDSTGINEKTYTIASSMDELYLRSETGTEVTQATYLVLESGCDAITLNKDGLSVEMIRE